MKNFQSPSVQAKLVSVKEILSTQEAIKLEFDAICDLEDEDLKNEAAQFIDFNLLIDQCFKGIDNCYSTEKILEAYRFFGTTKFATQFPLATADSVEKGKEVLRNEALHEFYTEGDFFNFETNLKGHPNFKEELALEEVKVVKDFFAHHNIA